MAGHTVPGMIIDCGSCAVRGQACADCVVTFLAIPVGAPRPHVDPTADLDGAVGPSAIDAGAVDLDAAERSAITVLARSGLVPPLRMRRVI